MMFLMRMGILHLMDTSQTSQPMGSGSVNFMRKGKKRKTSPNAGMEASCTGRFTATLKEIELETQAKSSSRNIVIKIAFAQNDLDYLSLFEIFSYCIAEIIKICLSSLSHDLFVY